MTNQLSISPEEMKTALEVYFSKQIGDLICQNAALEKIVMRQAQGIQDLKVEMAALKAEVISFAEGMDKEEEPVSMMTEEMKEIAEAGRRIIQGEDEEGEGI